MVSEVKTREQAQKDQEKRITEATERKRRKLEKGLVYPGLPILDIGEITDSEGKVVHYGFGLMTGKYEDLLRKVIEVSKPSQNVDMTLYTTIDQMVREWWIAVDPAGIKYIPPQEKIGEKVGIESYPEGVDEYIQLLDPKTKYEISWDDPEFPRIIIEI